MLAEQLMTMVLVVLVGLGVMQAALALHVRNTLVEAAAEGARLAARTDRTMSDGAQRAEAIAAGALGGIEATAHASSGSWNGADTVVVTVTAPIPLVGLWGPATTSVRGTALDEASLG